MSAFAPCLHGIYINHQWKTSYGIYFELEMQVRDYECDMEGIVNNAIYQHYLEHTRHEF